MVSLYGLEGLGCRVAVSQNKGAQYRPQYAIVFNIGTPIKVPPVLGNPQVLILDDGLWARLCWVHNVGVLMGKSYYEPSKLLPDSPSDGFTSSSGLSK